MDLETLLYLSVMPGLNEELVYRGLLLGLLNKVFYRKWYIIGASLGWGAVITSLLFGLLHGFWIDADYILHLNLFVIILNGITGLVYA